MKLLDANLLLYAVDATSPRNKAARKWLETALSDSETIAFCWPVLLAFVRIGTHRSIFAQPLTNDEALNYVSSWLGQPNVIVVHPTNRHGEVLGGFLSTLGTGGNLVSDAHLAALAIEHGAQLCSCDNDFARFPGLTWSDPLRDAMKPKVKR